MIEKERTENEPLKQWMIGLSIFLTTPNQFFINSITSNTASVTSWMQFCMSGHLVNVTKALIHGFVNALL